MLCALSFGTVLGAWGEESDPPTLLGYQSEGYLTSSDGTVVRSGADLCFHADSGADPRATTECYPSAPAAAEVVSVPPVAAAEPAPVVEAAPVAPPPPPPTPTLKTAARVQLDADTLFDFDRSTLRPAGTLALDEFVDKIRDLKPETIHAVGYTDRLGTTEYNQKLSERRVDTVKLYLESKGIDADKIQTEGRGKSDPVTVAGDCLGAQSVSVIACLQADRRVEIEVMVTETTAQEKLVSTP